MSALPTIFVCGLAAMLVIGPAAGFAGERDPDLPAVDPPGQGRVMTHDDATNTSQCIGNPITPLCAVETVIACFERNNDEFCRIGMGLDRPPEFIRGQPVPTSAAYHRYRVVSAKRYTEQNLPPPRRLKLTETPAAWWYTEDRRQYRPGDVEIVALRQTCWGKCGPVSTSNHYTYHLRRSGESWAVLNWDTPDPRFEKIRPDKF